MKITTILIFIVLVGLVLMGFKSYSDDLNTNYEEAQINITINGMGDPYVHAFAQDVVLAIDSSGSMKGSDPTEERLTAAKYYVDQLKPELYDRAAVVDFDDNAFLLPKFSGDHLSTDYEKIKSNIDTIDDSGSTYIPGAMEIANGELINYGWSNHTWVVILLTDGKNSGSKGDSMMDDVNDTLIKEAIDNSIAYYTIGLGDNVNAELLSNLSSFTGGSYHPAATADELKEIYDDIHGEIVTTAGKNITVKEVLMPDFDYALGSFSKPSTNLSGKVAEWGIPSLRIGETWSVSFNVSTDVCGLNKQIDNTTIVTYTSFEGGTDIFDLPSLTIDVIGCIQSPVADAGGPYLGIENSQVTLNGSNSFDPDGNIVSYEWDLDNDGVFDDASGEVVQFIWNDDYVNVVGLKVTDDSDLSHVSFANITINNVDPSVGLNVEMMNCAVGLRVAGSKWSNVNMTLYEDGVEVGFIEVERWPGKPERNPSVGSMPSALDLAKSYEAVVQYDPYPDHDDEIEGDQPNNGKDKHNNAGNPVWLTLDCDGGSKKIHHTFNVQQSKKRDSDHKNHVEPWHVDIKEHLVGFTFNAIGHETDPGSDDITFEWSYGSQTASHTYLNGAGPDPYYSPYTGSAPIELNDTMTFVYEGPGIITVAICDDDEGQPTDALGYDFASYTIS